MKIAGIRPGSPASRLQISPGDDLLSINGHPVGDQLDYLFHCADEELELVVACGDQTVTHHVAKKYEDDLGLKFGPLAVRHCGDNCIFCFVHQNPAGVRKSLMIQDEDYRHSFLHGNYVTLDNLREADFERIIEMRLSPLYVSVHTTDPDLRRRMLRGRNSGELKARMERLLAGGIQMYAQIVLVPGWNDGDHLMKTVHDLAEYHPGVPSVAVVPVGLTHHREGLTGLRRHTPGEMRAVIADSERWRVELSARLGCGFVYLSDEFFLASGTPLPAGHWYEGSYQEENGVGMATAFIDTFEGCRDNLRDEMESRLRAGGSLMRIVACTGNMGMEMFRRHLLGPMEAVGGLEFRAVECSNTFFGTSITTAGLLTGRCFASALGGVDMSGADALLLPPNCTNADGIFLDDVRLDEFAVHCPCIVEQGSYDIVADILNVARRLDRAEHRAN